MTIPKKNNLNLLRLLLAYIVLFRHSIDYSAELYLSDIRILFWSDAAVFCFYIISGMLITMSYEHSINIKQYILKRLKRIFPAYIVVIILSVIVLSPSSTLSQSEYWTNIATYKYILFNFITLGFLQSTLPGVFENNPYFSEVNGALWTVKIEIGFYILVPFICYFLHKIKSKKNQNIFLIVLYILSIMYKFFMLYMSKRFAMRIFSQFALQTPGYLNYFIMGMLLYYNFNYIEKYYKQILIFSIIPLQGFINSIIYGGGGGFFYPPIFAILIITLAFHIPILHKFYQQNDYSYGVYIYHAPIVQLAVSYDFFKQSPVFTLFLIFSTASFMGIVSWHFLEKHILKK